MKKILVILLVFFIIIQFFPIDMVNPVETPSMDFIKIKKTPENIATIIKTSCYNCHSNETIYPWYSKIAPVSFWLKNHIDEGRKKLNFSTFATYDLTRQAHKLEEASEVISKGEMPLESYTLGHPEAKLNENQKKVLVEYLKKIQFDMALNNTIPNTAVPPQKQDFQAQ